MKKNNFFNIKKMGLTLAVGIGVLTFNGMHVNAANKTYEFTYTGATQAWTVPGTGEYKIELWGAQGGGVSGVEGGRGGYVVGTKRLAGGQAVYLNVGGQGGTKTPGFNGGGTGGVGRRSNDGAGGGGASDIRLNSNDLTSRQLVSGGGGGAGGNGQGGSSGGTITSNTGGIPGVSGGLSGTSGSAGRSHSSSDGHGGGGATATSGGVYGISQKPSGSNSDGSYYPAGGGGGGGGWYGGGGGGGASASGSTDSHGYNGTSGVLGTGGNGGDGGSVVYSYFSGAGGAGGGGSSYLGTATDAQTIPGDSTMISPLGVNSTGNTGNGYVRITQLIVTPIVNLSKSTSAWTNNDVVISYNVQKGDNDVKDLTLPNGVVTTNLSGTYTVTQNGTYTFKSKDVNGNETIENLVISNIDRTAPSASLNAGSATNGRVKLSLSGVLDAGSGIKSVSLPNGTTTTTDVDYTVYENGLYEFVITDNAGNETRKSVEVTSLTNVKEWGYGYTGAPEQFTAPRTGEYQLEAWGAEGNYNGGKGGYAKGTFKLNKGDSVYAYVGQVGQRNSSAWNGGGSSEYTSLDDNGGGGGGTDFRLTGGAWNSSLYTRFIVAGGGGGGRGAGGYGGGESGGNPGGTQTSAGSSSSAGSFGIGASMNQADDDPGGGGGWYGGGIVRDNYGGGGSGYVHTTTSYRPSGYTVPTTFVAKDTQLISGNVSMPSPLGGTQTGQSGNGFAKITQLVQPPEITITQGKTAWESNSYNLIVTAKKMDYNVKEVVLPNGQKTTDSTFNYPITNNGTYTFTAYDEYGNSSSQSITVNNFDKIAPNGTVTQNPTNWTKEGVALTLANISDTGGSGFKSIRLPNGVVVTTTSATYLATANGNYTFSIEDNAGNVKDVTYTVSNIDKTAPVGSVTPDKNAWTNTPVTVTTEGVDVESGMDDIALATADYPGRNLLLNSSRELRGSSEFLQFADIAPIINKYGLVPITISFDIKSDLPGSIIVYNQNGSSTKYSIGYTPIQVTTTYQRKSVTVTPSVETASDIQSMLAFYGTYGSGRIPTVKNVKVELGSTETPYTMAPEDSVMNGNKKTFAFSQNGTYEFIFKDKAKNESRVSRTISNIDTIKPTATLTKTPTTWTNQTVLLSLKNILDDGGSGLKRVILPDGKVETNFGDKTFTVTENGTYDFKVEDVAGNIETFSTVVSNIDTAAPTGTITPNTTAWTNNDVVLNLNSVSDNEGSGFKQMRLPNGTVVSNANFNYTVTENGVYRFVLEDNVGNTRELSYEVKNIDKQAPEGTISYDGSTPSTGLKINLTTNDDISGIKEITLPNGAKVTTANATFTTKTAGSYSFVMEDNAGNKKTVTGTVEAPEWSVVRDKLDVLVTVNSKYTTAPITTRTEDARTWTSKTFRIPILKNETFTFTTNDGGIVSTPKSLTISNYFTLARPQIQLTYDENWTKGSVVIHVSAFNFDDRPIKSVQLPDGTVTTETSFDYTVDKNGIYSFVAEDEMGRLGFEAVEIKNIDLTQPKINVITPSDWSKTDVPIDIQATKN